MARRYAPLGTNIWGSDKFKRLQNDTHRLGYIYLLSSDHTTPIGVFRLPPNYVAEDRDITADMAEHMIADLADCGMIEVGPDHWVRVTRWFFEETGPQSPLNVIGFCTMFLDRRLERAGPLRSYAFAELAAATSQRALTWDQGSAPYGKMVKALAECTCTLARLSFADLTHGMARFGPVPEGGLLHIVLDDASNKTGAPVLDATRSLLASP